MITMLLVVPGCATWSTAEHEAPPSGTASTTEKRAPTQPEKILITTEDISDRPYMVLRDIKVTVNKTTIFHKDPTKAAVNARLREEAAKLGADAVILVRYGTVGVSVISWGSLDGRGRAVSFEK